MDDFLQRCYVKDSSLVAQQVIDELLLVPLHQDRLRSSPIYVMNEIAGVVWNLIDGTRRVEELVREIVRDFDVSPETAQADLIVFLQQLEKTGAVHAV